MLERLLDACGWTYYNVYAKDRRDGFGEIARSLLVREKALFGIVRRLRPDLMIGTSAEIAHVGTVLRIPSLVVNEDDWDVVPLFSWMAYPFATRILAPTSCRVGRWSQKTTTYEGYHELAYLHPNHFRPDPRVRAELGDRYFIVRFARLNAHHDAGRTGIPEDLARTLISGLREKGRVYITSERTLGPEWDELKYPLPPDTVHDALAFADLYVGDSQTMAAEAAVLGTPSIRFNDFVGQIGYLEELEHRYGLTRGIRTTDRQVLLETAKAWTNGDGSRALWNERRTRMLRAKRDVAQFMTEFIEEFVGGGTEEIEYDTVAAA